MTLPPLPPITLPDDIQPGSACAFLQMPAAVLLTGATGYYGSYVLAELLQRTSANIHCLVRAVSETEGLVRLRTNLATYGLAASSDLSRVRVVPGQKATGDEVLPRRALAMLSGECHWFRQRLRRQLDA